MLTQKILIMDRMGERESVYDEFLNSYLDLLPRNDMTQLLFWNKNVLTEIDSEILRNQLRETD